LSEISNGAERIVRCPVLPRPSTHGTSPVGIAWLYESPAAPDLHLMIPELPANQGVVLWRARFTGSHSSLKLVLYVIPVTTGIKASRPLHVDTSLLSSLSDCLRDSCVLVTKLSLSLVSHFLFSFDNRSHSFSPSSHSIFSSHSRVQQASYILVPVVQLSDTAASNSLRNSPLLIASVTVRF
jgi:hypothetical protein